MKINFKSISEGTKFFEFMMSASDLDLEDQDFTVRSADVKSTVSRNEQNIYVSSRVSAEIEVVCDSCLEEFVHVVEDQFSVYYTPDRESAAHDDEEVIHLIKPGSVEINLGDGVRECILLAIPMKIVCALTCKGLCPQCGINLNHDSCKCGRKQMDPRWEALKALANKS